jgi:hypothetical protein
MRCAAADPSERLPLFDDDVPPWGTSIMISGRVFGAAWAEGKDNGTEGEKSSIGKMLRFSSFKPAL